MDQHFTVWALYFPAGKLFIAQEMLHTMGTRKFEFAHNTRIILGNASHKIFSDTERYAPDKFGASDNTDNIL
jgi:hypothetical protein